MNNPAAIIVQVALASALVNVSVAAPMQRYMLDIPAQRLESALVALAETTGLQLLYTAQLARGLKNSPLQGEYTAEEALATLLSGTNLAFRFSDARTVTITKASDENGTRMLGPVRVEGAAQPDAVKFGEGVATLGGVRGRQQDETIGYKARVSTVGTGQPTPIEDNGRSVSVLTSEQIEDMNVNNLSEALTRLPGVSVSDNIYSRGQTIDKIQIDGSAPNSLRHIIGSVTGDVRPGPELGERLNLAAFERVELLRGVNAASNGDGSFGGTLNLVRKRPGSEPAETWTVTAGSWQRMESLYDVTVPNIGGSNIAVRGVLNWQNSNAFYDRSERENRTIYGIVDVPLSATSRAEFGVRHTDSHVQSPYQGIYAYMDGPLFDVPRSTNFGPRWSYADSRDTELFTRIETDFSPAWNISIGLSRMQSSLDELFMYVDNVTLLSNGGRTPFDSALNNTGIYERRGEYTNGDVRLTGRLEGWGLVHHLYAQATYSDYDGNLVTGMWNRRLIRNAESIADFFLDGVPRDSARMYRSGSADRLVQASLEDRISWRDKVDVRLGLSNYRSDQFSFTPAYVYENYPGEEGPVDYYMPSDSTYNKTRPNWTPTYALVLKPWRGWSIAPNYAEGTASHVGYYTPSGEVLPPSKYRNKELMVRYGASDWGASVSYYTANNTNVAEPIPGVVNCGPTRNQPCYFLGSGTTESSGYDLELVGSLFRQLDISASYNYNRTETISTNQPLNPQAPERTAKLFLNWRPPALPGLGLNLGYSYRPDIYYSGHRYVFDDSGTLIGAVPFDYVTPGHHLFDLGAQYEISPNLQLALLAENLTDETYLSTRSPNRGYYGRPRNISLTFTWRDPSIGRWGGVGTRPDHFPLGDPSRWYTGVELGYHAATTVSATSPKTADDGGRVRWDWELGSNFLVFWRLGHHLNDRWRVEFEAGFRPANIETTLTAGAEPRGLCSKQAGAQSYPECTPAEGKFDTFSAMVNGLYAPLGSERRVSPFVGLGLGVAVSQVGIGGRLSNLSPAGTEIGSGTDSTVTSPAAQALAGVALRLAPRLTADLAYRYFYAPDVQWDISGEYPQTGSFASYGLQHFSGDLKDQSVTLALRWNFDAGTR